MKQKTFLHKSSQPYPEPSIQKWGKENKKENLSKCCKCIYHSPMMSDAEYIWSSIQSYLVLRGVRRTGLNWTLDLVLIVEISITWFSTKERFQMKERLKKAELHLSIFCQTAPPLAEGWCSRPLKIGIYSKFKTLYLMKSELFGSERPVFTESFDGVASDAFFGFLYHKKANHRVLHRAPFAKWGINKRPQYG